MNTAPHRRIAVIIAAAGSGARCGGGIPKQWRPLPGGSLVERSCRSFLPASLAAAGQTRLPEGVVIAVDVGHRRDGARLAGELGIRAEVVTGGETRLASVRNALAKMPDGIELVCVHDAVRPFWPMERWDALVRAAGKGDGAILAVPVADTLKRREGGSLVTLRRNELWAAQTPQVFRTEILCEAHRRAAAEGVLATDDADPVERIGGRIAIVPSSTANIKVTTPEDWALVERLAGAGDPSGMRVGIGFDAHRLGGDGPLVLGGVRLADHGGLIGHSDGDVLLHAICDALLGAAALGDIGHHFPPDDPRFAGIDSRILLRETAGLLAAAGYRPSQIDAVVMAEAPRLAPYASTMCELIAADCGIPVRSVSVKATTTEKMGFVGRNEGIAAQAIATIAPLGANPTRGRP